MEPGKLALDGGAHVDKKNFILKFEKYVGINSTDEEFDNVKWLLEDRILGHLKQKG